MFYKVTVTYALCCAVGSGFYPAIKTEVLKYNPVLPSYLHPPMYPLKNRAVLLACPEAPKQLIGNQGGMDVLALMLIIFGVALGSGISWQELSHSTLIPTILTKFVPPPSVLLDRHHP